VELVCEFGAEDQEDGEDDMMEEQERESPQNHALECFRFALYRDSRLDSQRGEELGKIDKVIVHGEVIFKKGIDIDLKA
jgi:hypothetical protein